MVTIGTHRFFVLKHLFDSYLQIIVVLNNRSGVFEEREADWGATVFPEIVRKFKNVFIICMRVTKKV